MENNDFELESRKDVFDPIVDNWDMNVADTEVSDIQSSLNDTFSFHDKSMHGSFFAFDIKQ